MPGRREGHCLDGCELLASEGGDAHEGESAPAAESLPASSPHNVLGESVLVDSLRGDELVILVNHLALLAFGFW